MSTVLHSSLSGSEAHEPKGADTASANQVYVSDGAGSGSFKTVYTHGTEDYNDTSGSQSLTSGSWVDLVNTGLGANSSFTYRLPGFNATWDTSSNEFDWDGAGLTLGDKVGIRFDVTVTASSANDWVALRLDLGHGDASEFPHEVFREQIKTAGTYQITRYTSIYMGSSLVLDNPAKVSMWTDGSGNSVVVNGWAVWTIPNSPVFN